MICDKLTVDNEVNDYVDCMYVSTCEAVWRIMRYDIYYIDPHLERLPFYLICE